MSFADEQSRKRDRDYLFQCLHRALPEDEKNVLKEYAKKTLQDKPPTMGKNEESSLRSPSILCFVTSGFYYHQFMLHVLDIAEKYHKDLVPGFQRHFSPHLARISGIFYPSDI
jgi:hypothetical protein